MMLKREMCQCNTDAPTSGLLYEKKSLTDKTDAHALLLTKS